MSRQQRRLILATLCVFGLLGGALAYRPPHLKAIARLNACGGTVLSFDREPLNPFILERWSPPLASYAVNWRGCRGVVAPSYTAMADKEARAVRDADLACLAELGSVSSLDLTGAQTIGDEGLVHLEKLKDLKYLNLRGTTISDAGLERLVSLPALETLILKETAVSEAGVASLKKRRPDLSVYFRED